MKKISRRKAIGVMGGAVAGSTLTYGAIEARNKKETPGGAASKADEIRRTPGRKPYTGYNLNRIAFPMGGIGAGMVCLEGTGGFSHVSVRNRPDIKNEPSVFAALCVKGEENVARVVEGPVPRWKILKGASSSRGHVLSAYGLPRFDEAAFDTKFPFADINFKDKDIPLDVGLTGWSPFIPGDEDNSSLPVGALEYKFRNPTRSKVEAIFSFHSRNFMAESKRTGRVLSARNGFTMWDRGSAETPTSKGGFRIWTDHEAIVDHAWQGGKKFDALVVTWRSISEGVPRKTPPFVNWTPGASLSVPFSLAASEEKTIRVMFAWHVPNSNISAKKQSLPEKNTCTHEDCKPGECVPSTYSPWYSTRFKELGDIVNYWETNYSSLRKKSLEFSDCFYDTTLPDEVVEAVAANLTILKSPTVLRQRDGKLWGWEGCDDESGCCAGTCTHVWNYAQAICHLFPELERSLRHTEFFVNQDESGGQVFRSPLPIGNEANFKRACADGQLGGIMKIYREWRISGDTDWMKSYWPKVKSSLDFCIKEWDPEKKGVLEMPHSNTYDIQFWGTDGMCTSIYLGALAAAVKMGKTLGEGVATYEELGRKGKEFLESKVYNGEYFYQIITPEVLEKIYAAKSKRPDPKMRGNERPSELAGRNVQKWPPYQYGTGCISDGVIGCWFARDYGIGDVLEPAKVKSTLKSIYKYNFKADLSDHANPQRPGFALGDDGGLLLCSWPRGGRPLLPFIYSDEVWTGIEYQVAAHMMFEGMVDEGLEIVRTCRERYDGEFRNPFDEYECGHWYARAMSSYSLIQSLTGVRYDAVDKTLYVDSRVGNNFRSFLSTETGYGAVGLKNGRPFVEMASGKMEVKEMRVSGETLRVDKIFVADAI
ncbi:GH116 family glycosyl hydrolase [Candidatus Hydrogenedentota bacterium]